MTIDDAIPENDEKTDEHEDVKNTGLMPDLSEALDEWEKERERCKKIREKFND